MRFVIETLDNNVWSDCGEGPWDTRESAQKFGDAEVGVEWRIVDARTGFTDEQDALVDSIADDLRPMVKRIESGIKTTQNNYGKYLNLLITLAPDDAVSRGVFAESLRRAGGNPAGIASALKQF